jgi:hypothetical protein
MSRLKLTSPRLIASSAVLSAESEGRWLLPTRRQLGRLMAGATLAAAGGIGSLVSPALADEPTPLGAISRLRKTAGATRDNDSRSLAIGDKVYRGDLLWTRSGGQLRVDLKDGSNLSLGENAEVTVDDSMLSGGGSAFLRIVGGAFRFSSGGGEKAEMPPKIETPFAVLSLRGTELYGLKFGKAWGFFVSDGQVEVSNETGSVVLNKGDGTEIYSRTGKFEPVKQWGAPKIAHTKAQFLF